MTQPDPIAQKNWRALVEAFQQRKQNEAALKRNDDPEDQPDIHVENVASHVFHRGKFPNRLRVTTIAE